MTIGGALILCENNPLKDLSPLANLTYVGGDIQISENGSLNSIEGLKNIDPGTIKSINLAYNPMLSVCQTDPICKYAANPNCKLVIFANASGCNDEHELKHACSETYLWIDPLKTTSIEANPNPFQTSTTITLMLERPSAVRIAIANYLGQQIQVNDISLSEGKYEMLWDASGLPSGIYYGSMKTADDVITFKMIKKK
jgi:hypothetical protein